MQTLWLFIKVGVGWVWYWFFYNFWLVAAYFLVHYRTSTYYASKVRVVFTNEYSTTVMLASLVR